MDNTKEIELNLTNVQKEVEFASIEDADLLRIRAYAVTEGENLNGTIFPRKILFLAYKTFIDKPVVIVPNKDDLPTGHGYDFKKNTFDINKRKNIGHIVNAFPVLVDQNGEYIEVYGVEDLNNYPDRELRIIVDAVIYKNYYSDIVDKLQYLHNTGSLSLSMESVISAINTEDNGKVATDVSFTGLAIVDKPAFVNSKSIALAEKEEEEMDYEKAYNELLEKYNALKEEAECKGSDKKKKKSNCEEENAEVTNIKEELAGVKAELAEANATIESLKPFKEKVEVAEKKALGEERAEKLKKLGVEKDATELAELTKEQFADELIVAAENFKPVVEVAETKVISSNFHESKLNENYKDILSEALKGLM